MNVDYSKVMAHVRRGQWCDTGHYYCPRIREDGTIVFPSGIVRPDGKFQGAAQLLSEIILRCDESLPVFAPGSFGAKPEDCPATGIVLN